MRSLSFLVLPAIIIAIAGFGWVLMRSAENSRALTAQEVELSPWDSLTSDEISRASASVKERHGEDVVFPELAYVSPINLRLLLGNQGKLLLGKLKLLFASINKASSHFLI